MVVQLSNEKEPRLFWGADVLKDGTILLTDLEKGLVAIRPSGIEETLIAPPGAGSVVRVDPSQRCAAFTYPVESLGDVGVTVGIGLLDLEGDKEPRLILGPQPGKGSPMILGWLGERIVFWWVSLPRQIYTTDLEGGQHLLADLTTRDIQSYLPMRAGLLPYYVNNGPPGVIDLNTGKDTILAISVSRLRWTKEGLEALGGGQRFIVVEVGP
jgi:hypothetical protein